MDKRLTLAGLGGGREAPHLGAARGLPGGGRLQEEARQLPTRGAGLPGLTNRHTAWPSLPHPSLLPARQVASGAWPRSR